MKIKVRKKLTFTKYIPLSKNCTKIGARNARVNARKI